MEIILASMVAVFFFAGIGFVIGCAVLRFNPFNFSNMYKAPPYPPITSEDCYEHD
jgi:hypothetical protein